MKNIHLYLIASILLLIPTLLWAEEPLSLKDCFKAALKRSEVLATQQELVVQAEENYHRAWGTILPAINGSYSYFHQDAESSAEQKTLKIMADQPLFRGFRDFAAVNVAKAFIT